MYDERCNHLNGFGCALNTVAFRNSLRIFSSSSLRCSSFSCCRRSLSVLKFSSNCLRSFNRASLCKLNGTGVIWHFSICGTNGFLRNTSGSGFETNGFGRKLASYSSLCEFKCVKGIQMSMSFPFLTKKYYRTRGSCCTTYLLLKYQFFLCMTPQYTRCQWARNFC